LTTRPPEQTTTCIFSGRSRVSPADTERPMTTDEYDCIIIGSGPGGYVAAIRAAQLGLRTAVIEQDRIGGRCLNYACIPANAMLRAADVLSEIRAAEEFGIKVEPPQVDYPTLTARRDKVVHTLTGGVAGLLRKNRWRSSRQAGRSRSPARTVLDRNRSRHGGPRSTPRRRAEARSAGARSRPRTVRPCGIPLAEPRTNPPRPRLSGRPHRS
jgi:choline dehydrogenase-like flavoprotein